MTDTTLCHANFPIRIPECRALFAFDNASNHYCFAEDALIASGVSWKAACMREGFDHARRLPHPLDNHLNISLRGKAKVAEAILRERGLWLNNGGRSDGY